MDAQSATSATKSVSNIVFALAPAFIAGFAVQQAIEVIDSLISAAKKWADDVKLKKQSCQFCQW